jgi:organic hydroperoxide reductase OsmC/OhrA
VPEQQPKRFEYAVAIDTAGALRAGGGPALELGDEWSPDHLLLAGLVTCVLASLRYHARRGDIEAEGSGTARGVVTKREEDGRYAFVEIEAELDVALAPQPNGDELSDLLAKAERDCFVGASLTVPPRYRWIVSGRPVERTAAEATGSPSGSATP